MERLRRKRDLQQVFAQGQRCYSAWVVAQVRQRAPEEEGGSGLRMAVVAGRKLGNAVRRNRAKRLLREALREAVRGWEGPWDVALIARAGLFSLSPATRVEELSALLRRAGLLPGEAAEA